MGYTHYWYREAEISEELFTKIVDDSRKVIKYLIDEYDLKLGDGLGEKEPIINNDEILFNGSIYCGHPKNEALIIPWPSEIISEAVIRYGVDEPISGEWFAGAEISTRVCNGDCSYETFYFPRIQKPYDFERNKKLLFHCTKTAFRPYDLAVTSVLIIAKHYLGNSMKVSSDGEIQHWLDGMLSCYKVLNYGMDFNLEEE